MTGKNNHSWIKELERLVDRSELLTEPEACAPYGTDKWFASAQPDAVVLPLSAVTISKVLKFASENRVPVTARGAGVCPCKWRDRNLNRTSQ